MKVQQIYFSGNFYERFISPLTLKRYLHVVTISLLFNDKTISILFQAIILKNCSFMKKIEKVCG